VMDGGAAIVGCLAVVCTVVSLYTVRALQGAHLQPPCESRSFERPAEPLKSRRECGEKMPNLQFSGFRRLFQIPARFCM